MNWHDITLTMHEEMAVWPEQKPFKRITLNTNDKSYLSEISLCTHTGTHVDAPRHFIKKGKDITEIDLELLVGPCKVIEINSDKKLIEVSDLRDKIEKNDNKLLVKTKNSEIIHDNVFHKDYISFSVEAINFLLEKGIRLLGIDYFSIAPFEDTNPVHRTFLKQNNTLALEGIDLSNIEPGKYQLICLPMKIEKAGGAPARVLLGEL